jgi:hypothetical protein
VTINDIEKELHLSRAIITRVLQKFQTKRYVQLEPLSDKIYIRLLRKDFRFLGKKRQKKFIKHHSSGIRYKSPDEYDGIMYE